MTTQELARKLEEEVRALEVLLGEERRRTRIAARRSAAIACGVALAAVLFAAANYAYVRREFTEENFSRSLEKEMVELSPTAGRELGRLQENVVPVYVEEARRQIRSTAPEISKRFHTELDQLSGDILAGAHGQLRGAEDRILAATEKALFASYPDFRDEAAREALGRSFHASAEEAVVQVATTFDQRFSGDLKHLEKTLLKFDVSDGAESNLDVQKQFIRLWLQLLDQEITDL